MGFASSAGQRVPPDEAIMLRSEIDTWRDDRYLQTVQYADSSRLSVRANIHAKYGRGDWFAWLAAQPDWPGDGDVLEVGCGAGWFWAKSASLLPAGLRLRLTDLSLGMVSEALSRVARAPVGSRSKAALPMRPPCHFPTPASMWFSPATCSTICLIRETA